MGRRRQGITILQKTNNYSTEDLVKNEGNTYPIADSSRVICMPNEFNDDLKEVLKEELKEEVMEVLREKFKENIQKQLIEYQDNTNKKLEKT
jgi:SUMO ligase MMS21 Smc5/6 complex component